MRWRIVKSLWVQLRADPWRSATWLLFIVAAAVVLGTFRDYGVIWDEPFQVTYGDLIVDYFRSGFVSEAALHYSNLYLYGGAFDAPAQWLASKSSLGLYETRHLLTALLGLLGALGCYRLGSLLGGPKAGFFAALLLLITPRYYGHMFNNPKDIPFAVGYLWAVYYLVQSVSHSPRLSIQQQLGFGIATGFAQGVRVGGILLLAYLGLVLVGGVVRTLMRTRRLRPTALACLHAARSLLIPVVLSYAIMLAFWPWAQKDPLLRPFEALERISHFEWFANVLFQGNWVSAHALPATYAPVWFWVTLPEILWMLVSLGAVGTVWAVARGKNVKLAEHALMIFVIVFPVGYVIVRQAALYDEVRHLLFVVPPFVCLAGSVAARLTERAKSWPQTMRLSIGGLAAGYVGLIVWTMSALHPYQVVYFNHFVGGLKGANGRYETDYWGNSYREATLWLVRFVENEHRKDPNRIFLIGIHGDCGHPVSATYFFPLHFRATPHFQYADFAITTTRWNCHTRTFGKVIHQVERFGVPLAIIKDNRFHTRPSATLAMEK